jgi:hypothetical protein
MMPVPGSCSLRTLRCGGCPRKTGRACQCGAISAPGAPRFANPSRLGTPSPARRHWQHCSEVGPARAEAGAGPPGRRRPATQRLGLEASTEGGLRSHRVHIQVVLVATVAQWRADSQATPGDRKPRSHTDEDCHEMNRKLEPNRSILEPGFLWVTRASDGS